MYPDEVIYAKDLLPTRVTISVMSLNSGEEITLSSYSVYWGVHLPLSLNDTIEQ